MSLRDDVAHVVRNAAGSWSAAVHVYAGDFFNAGRSEWNADGYGRRPLSIEAMLKRYEAAVRGAPPALWAAA